MRKIAACFLITLLFINQTTSAKKHTWKPHRPPFDTSEFCKDLVKLYIKDWIAIFAHEFGKAVAEIALTNNQTNIHLGHKPLPQNGRETINDQIDKANIFRIESKQINVYTPFPVGGFNLPGGGSTQNIAIILAGPLSGALAYYLMNVYSTYLDYKNHDEKWTWKKLFKESFLDADIYRHLLKSLFPTGSNEGGKIAAIMLPQTKDITSNKFYNAGAQVVMGFILQEILGKIDQKRTRDPRFMYKENVKNGNRFFMAITHKILAAAKCYHKKQNNFDFEKDTAFNVNDVIAVMNLLLYQNYFASLKKVYVR